MEIVFKRTDDLKEYAGNARRNENAVAKVADSIKCFGFLNPIVIDTKNVIISGHTRLKAAKSLGLDEVPCIIQDMTEEDAKLVRIIDNKSHEYATWDFDKLQQELSNIKLDFKKTFFATGRDRKFFQENKVLRFGNYEAPITEQEYSRLKKVYDWYVEKNKTYIGFIMYLTGADKVEH